jgi:hypothetical protein
MFMAWGVWSWIQSWSAGMASQIVPIRVFTFLSSLQLF